MDNKITKKRLFDFLSYEWIAVIIVVVLSIIAWELIYGITRVQVTPGQDFRVFYDVGLDNSQGEALNNYLYRKGAFSYDVLELVDEGIVSDYEVLDIRIDAQEGDIIFTDKAQKGATVRAKHIIDRYPVYGLYDLLDDAKEYLRSFLKDGVTAENAELEFSNLDKAKIEANFSNRLKKDNRIRKAKDRAEYLEKEYQRIEKLCIDTKDYEFFLENAPEEVFYKYTRFEQLSSVAAAENSGYGQYYIDLYGEWYQEEITAGRVDYAYGINMEALTGGEVNASRYISKMSEATAKDTVLVVFDMKVHQPDLQYETVSFIAEIVRSFSNILSK